MAEDKKEEKKEEKGAKKEEKEEAKKEGEGGTPAEGAEGEQISDEEKAKKAKKKKLILVAALALALLMGGGAAAFLVIKSKKSHEAPPATEEEGHGEKGAGGEAGEGRAPEANAEGQPIFIDLPEFLVNLNSTGKQTSFLKIVVTLDVPDEKAKQAVDANMPRIRDNFQVYLHELRVEDLKGSAGLQLLREELLLRINRVIYPQKINDILFKEVLVQ